MADLPEGFWNNLLDYIQDRTVVPVIGSELVTVREGDREVQLYRWLAERLAADLGLPTAELPQGFDLNDVVSLHLLNPRRRFSSCMAWREITGRNREQLSSRSARRPKRPGSGRPPSWPS